MSNTSKPRPPKKMTQSAAIQQEHKQLIVAPQILVALQPDGSLTVELPNKSGSRHKVILQDGQVEKQLYQMLYQQAADIEHERLAVQAESARAKLRARRYSQPNWRLIAQHPEATILERTSPVTVCPTGAGLTALKSDRTLEDMGL